jgi:hypothetical protein
LDAETGEPVVELMPSTPSEELTVEGSLGDASKTAEGDGGAPLSISPEILG